VKLEAFPVRAPLIGIANEKQFVSFLERSDSESMAVVMPASFFTRYTLHHLAQVDLSQGAGRATRGYEALGGYSGRVLCKRPCLYVLFPDPTYSDEIFASFLVSCGAKS
jgi:hypothetical protein